MDVTSLQKEDPPGEADLFIYNYWKVILLRSLTATVFEAVSLT